MTAPCPDRAYDPGEALDLHHKPRITALIAKLEKGLSEYCFANLYLFRNEHSYRFVDGSIPHVVGTTYDGVVHAMPLVTLDGCSADLLLKSVDVLYPVPAADVEEFGLRHRDARAEDADYLYDASELASLSAPAARDRRRQAALFEANHPRLELKPRGFVADALNVLDRWLDESGRRLEDTDARQCREAIALASDLGLSAALVRVNDRPAAFLLASTLADGSKAVHFAKGSRTMTGCYPWLFSRYAAVCGARRLNFEQDLGKPGFRQAKRALGPVARLDKYRLW